MRSRCSIPGRWVRSTPAYASCEVIDGAEPDASDDVYAISCVIYELLTGVHPFERMSGGLWCAPRTPFARAALACRASRWRAPCGGGWNCGGQIVPLLPSELLDSFTSKPFARWTLASAAAAGVAVLAVGALLLRGHRARCGSGKRSPKR